MTQALLPAQPVGIVGCGAMGAGIAQVAALAGHPVRLFDARDGAAGAACARIGQQLQRLVDKARLDAAVAEAAAQRLQACASLDEFADCALVVEAIVEQLEPKRELLAALEAVVGDDCVLASNTSSISITALGALLRRPQRLAGLHFFNPAPVMALVEVVSGLATAPQVAQTLQATAAAWGKTPVLARSTPGFIVNRVARPFYGEALRVRGEGGADCATLDAVMREAGGFRMGPFELMDMIGLDINYAVTCSVWSAFYHDARYTPSLQQRELVDAGWLGRKSGRGFYLDGEVAQAATEAPRAAPRAIALHGDDPLAAALARRLGERGVAFERRGAAADARVASVDGCALHASDGRSATARAAADGVAALAVVDLALDYARAPRLALACAEQCPPPSADAAIGLLQAAGYAVSRLADLPGLIVLRTVAMLANEAADAVHQQVADAAAVDRAMRLGVNYPLGPLQWADAIGVQRVREVLAHLGAFYGEDRYRISPLIQQRACAARALSQA